MDKKSMLEAMINHYTSGNKAKFANLLGVSAQTISAWGTRNTFDAELIYTKCREVSADWLLTGEGSMLRIEETSPTELLPSINQEYKGAPYYNVDFIGGFDLTFNDQTQNPDYYINYYPYNKEGVVWCNVTGHSMEPKINHGDVIALKNCTLNDVQYGEIYAVVLDTIRTVKILRKSQDPAKLRFVPINTNDFDEQEFEKKRIVKLYEVLGSISKFF
ncbi:LexA family transcriptional regulator [Bacteroides finegoldii]|jgi:phage repressor protein C with HTH and peptisase S24 domain|uniref:LexA family transcriptional regulator n=1 Tax=Bacteroides finegoldii TaxID=338188 RepID=UPI0018A0C457|nr:S24 family peptidase [Bacteroides finegoldii]MDC7140295.1 S24 family peptidase [Bacteroides finegoldii]